MPIPHIIEIIFKFIPSTLIIFIFFESNLTAKYNKYLQITLGSIAYYMTGVIGQYLRNTYKLTSVDLSLAVILFIGYSIFLHKESLRYKLFIGVLTILAIVSCETVFASIVFTILPDITFQIGNITIPMLIAVQIEYIFVAIVCFLITKLIKKIRFQEKTNKKALIFLLFPTSQVFLLAAILKILMMNPDNMTNEVLIWILLCVVISVISDIFSYRGLIQNSQLHETRLRNEQLEYERNAQYRYYEKISDMQHEIMKYRHDFKNALTTAYALCDNAATAEEGKKMLDELKKRNDDNKMPFFCANPIANTILWDKSKVAKEKGIEFVSEVSLGEDTGLNGVDLCSLIVNMLDNAIRGAEKSEKEKRVTIKIKEDNDRIFMTVSNTADMPDFESSDKLPSTKGSKNHGYGTEIIKTIVAKYNGDVLFSCKDNSFSTILTMERESHENTDM